MAQLTIGIGSAVNDGTGDPLRTAFTKTNANFTELYTSVASLQSSDADLTAIAALSGTSGFLKKTAANSWALDTSTYATLTGAETLTNKTLTSPKSNEILDTNGVKILSFLPTTSATDYLVVQKIVKVLHHRLI
jgi:hypothetical protein